MLQIPLSEIAATYSLQAWLLSVTGAVLGAVKAILWIKDSNYKGSPNGNGKLMLAKESGKFESQILLLTERVVDLNESVQETQKRDREQWAPALASLMDSQNKMMEQLDEHSQHTQKAWAEMIGEFGRMVDKVAELPCTQEREEEQ